MKRMTFAAVALALSCGAAHAQSAQQRYQGAFFVTNTAGCEYPDGSIAASKGDHFVFVFRTDDTKQAMSIYQARRALAFVPEKAKFGASGDYVGTTIPSGAIPRTVPGRYLQTKMTPGNFEDDNTAVRVTGKIQNFEGLEGCTVTYEAGGVRRPGFPQ